MGTLIWIVLCVLGIGAIGAANLHIAERSPGGPLDSYRRMLVQWAPPRSVVTVVGLVAVAGLIGIALASHAPWYGASAIVMVGVALAVGQHHYYERLRRAQDCPEEP